MRIYPAIDIKDGQCVRLIKGDFNQTTVFHDDPAAVAAEWQASGARFLHLVDLDGARYGTAHNDEAVKKILARISIPAQIGGGIRTMSDIKRKLDMGVTRVILGTAALENPALVREAAEAFGARVAVGIDAVDGMVAISGWQTVTRTDMHTLCQSMEAMGIQTVICTDIAKDGMMTGPNTALYAALTAATGMSVVASGGVSRPEDLDALAATGVSGVIVGKALYLKTVDLRDAVAKYDREEDV